MKYTYLKLQNIIKNSEYSIKELYSSLLAIESKIKLNKIEIFEGDHKQYINESLIQKLEEEIHTKELEPALTYLLERYSNQKKTGTYYTPSDVSDFLSKNLLNDFSEDKKLLDPMCGTGSLIFAFLKNIDVSKNYYKNIYAVDIDEFALHILRQRMYVHFISLGAEKKNLKKYLLKNIYKSDILNQESIYPKVDLIISNPPYFEIPTKKYGFGNIYAFSLNKMTDFLKSNGALSVIVPISFQTTNRMEKLRNKVFNDFNHVKISSFADRPDSLFKGVHQKINIIYGSKSKILEPGVFTTKYNIWRSENRSALFTNISYFKNNKPTYMIGSNTHNSIIEKITSYTENITRYEHGTSGCTLYVSSRIAQWSKAFIDAQKNGEYLKINLDTDNDLKVLFCIFNSNTFWVLWATVSDGWHNSMKIIRLMKITETMMTSSKLVNYSKKLRMELENNKVFINSKQIDYIFKHNLSKKTIDDIDKEIGNHLGLNDEEIEFIKNIEKGVK